MAATEDVLEGVAAAILDGTPIDWSRAKSGATKECRELLEEFHLLATLANVHRPRSFPELPFSDAVEGQPPASWGRLRLIQRIGSGSFGQVYRAWDPRLHREVALKLIPADAGSNSTADDMIREGRLLARIQHPGVVTIYDAEQIGPDVGLCMELVEGQTLQQRLDQRGPFRADETLDVALQLCDALSAVHNGGVLHRDIKASNVVIRTDGRVALMDFGAGRHSDDDLSKDIKGTPLCLAPEVLRGQDPTVQSDVYSVGVLLHCMLTGSYPVSATSISELHAAHERRVQEGAPGTHLARMGIPAPFAAIIERALDPHPHRRYETVAALARDLRRLQGSKAGVNSFVAGWIAALLVLAVAAGAVVTGRFAAREPLRIAILPFAIARSHPNGDTLREGMARDLIARMEKHRDVQVISAASILSPNALKLPLPDLGRRLGVSLVLTGRLEWSGATLGAEAKLVRVSDERTVWSRQYDRPASQMLSLYSALAADLTDELRLKRRDSRAQTRVPDLDAHSLYMRGQAALDRFTAEDQRDAKQLFEEAIALDASYAQPYAGVARVYLHMNPQFPSDEPLRRASDAVDRALALDAAVPEAHVAAAIVKSAKADWAGAERDFRSAIHVGPSNVVARQEYAHWLSLHARFEEALEHARLAESLDPLSVRAILAVSSVLRFARRYDEALVYTHKALEIDATSQAAYSNLGHCYQGLGRLDEAIVAFERHSRASGNLANALAHAGRLREARAVVDLLEARYARDGVGAGELAQASIGLGEIDRAFEWLDRQRHTWPTTFKVAAVWDPLRSDPRFRELLKRRGFAD